MDLTYLYQSMPIIYDISYICIMYHCGIIKGFCIIWAVYAGFVYVMEKVFKLTKVSSGDMVLMWNSYEKTYNLSMIIKLDKMDPKKLKEYLVVNMLEKFPKMRSKLAFKLCHWWWQQVSLQEAIDNIHIIEDDTVIFKTEDDLTNYISNQLKVHIDLEKDFPYRLYLLKNEKSAPELRNIGFFKIDHAFADGMSCTLLSTGVAFNYSAGMYPSLASKEITIFKKLILMALFPYNILRIAYNYILRVKDRKTPLRMANKQTGIANIAVSKQMDFEEMRTVTKKLGVTFNNLIASINLATVKKYFKEVHNYEDKIINVYTPIGMVPIPKKKEDIVISNNTTGFGAKLDFISDPLTEYPKIVKGYGKFVNDYSMSYAQKIITDWFFYFLPFYLARSLSLYIFRCYDLVISNVPGSKEMLNYGDSNVIDMFPMLTPGFKPSFFVFYSYLGKFRAMISVDQTLDIDPKDLMKRLENEIDHCMKVARELPTPTTTPTTTPSSTPTTTPVKDKKKD